MMKDIEKKGILSLTRHIFLYSFSIYLISYLKSIILIYYLPVNMHKIIFKHAFGSGIEVGS